MSIYPYKQHHKLMQTPLHCSTLNTLPSLLLPCFEAVPPMMFRYGLNPGGSEEDEGDQSAVEHLASTLQGMQVSGCEAPSFRVFR